MRRASGARRAFRLAIFIVVLLTALIETWPLLRGQTPPESGAAGGSAPRQGAPSKDQPVAGQPGRGTSAHGGASVEPITPPLLLGRVVGVADGDTITVLDASLQEHRIRVVGIDAPERSQPWGQRARQSMADLVFEQPVRVEWRKRDRYGRVLGTIWVAPLSADCRGHPQCPKTLDAGSEQLSRGMAWWYRQFARDQDPEQRSQYEQLEAQARQQRVGLWQQTTPQAPWEYRRQK